MKAPRRYPIGLVGISESVKERLIVGLNRQVANLTDLGAAYKQAHWNIAGTDFAQLHTMFDQFNDEVREYTDVLAERAMALGGTVQGTIQAAVEHSVLPAFPCDERDQRRLVQELTLRTGRVIGDLREAMETSAEDAATQDVYIQVLRGMEKQNWMLQAHVPQP